MAAADIEVGWGGSPMARRWVDQYATANEWLMADFGDAAGCRTSGTTKTSHQCSGSWYQDDLYYISWGALPAVAVPEIYLENGDQAKQWQQISKWATLNGKGRLQFRGSLTQHGACGNGCNNGTNNLPSEGWNQLITECARDSATSLSNIEFAADIDKH